MWGRGRFKPTNAQSQMLLFVLRQEVMSSNHVLPVWSRTLHISVPVYSQAKREAYPGLLVLGSSLSNHSRLVLVIRAYYSGSTGREAH